jgi:hypothetical protein
VVYIPATPDKRPGKLYYALAIVTLMCVAVLVPQQYSVLIFLGFIFVILMEVSYRLTQQYYLNKSTSESMNRVLSQLDQQDKDGIQRY